MTNAEFFVGTSENIDPNLHLSDIIDGYYLHHINGINKFYEIVEIKKLIHSVSNLMVADAHIAMLI